MVQIYSIAICKDLTDISVSQDENKLKCVVLASHIPPPSWSAYFYRNSINEFTMFISKFVTVRTPKGMKQQIDKENLIAFVKKDIGPLGLACVVVTDKEYPARVAFNLTDLVLESVIKHLHNRRLMNVLSVARTEGLFQKELADTLKDFFTEFQDPVSKDKMLKAKENLDSLTKAAHVTIEQLLNRGERIDDLVAESPELSNAAKAFYIHSKRTNCCTIL